MLKPNLPIYQFKDKSLMMLQTVWKAAISPAIASDIVQGQIIRAKLTAGNTTFNHLLSRQMVGWYIVDVDAATEIYRSGPLNDQTLTLNSSAPCSVSVWVF